MFSTDTIRRTAQVANQQAKWLGKRLNKGDLDNQHFSFKNLGVMTYLGNYKAIMQTGGHNEVKGWTAWILWRGGTVLLLNTLIILIRAHANAAGNQQHI